MAEFRRQVLDSIIPEESTNAGLWLDKYLLDDKEDAKKNLVKQVFDEIKISKAYEKFYQKWESELNARGIQLKEAKTLGRLAVNLGAESTLENSIALNRTYGVPYIPGSALKGLAASYARKSVENFDAEIHADIFGRQESAGYVTFFDALLVPNKKLGLVPDVVTVHHQEYYQKDKDVPPPADWDSPIPIHFLSASGTFLIALSGPSKNLVDATYKILAYALRDEGIGAKTSSGYGRMQFENSNIAGSDEKKLASENAPVVPPKGAIWKKGKISSDGKAVHPDDAPNQKLYFNRQHIFPKGYTPGRKSDVEYVEEILPDGNIRIWVKRMYYPVGLTDEIKNP